MTIPINNKLLMTLSKINHFLALGRYSWSLAVSHSSQRRTGANGAKTSPPKKCPVFLKNLFIRFIFFLWRIKSITKQTSRFMKNTSYNQYSQNDYKYPHVYILQLIFFFVKQVIHMIKNYQQSDSNLAMWALSPSSLWHTLTLIPSLKVNINKSHVKIKTIANLNQLSFIQYFINHVNLSTFATRGRRFFASLKLIYHQKVLKVFGSLFESILFSQIKCTSLKRTLKRARSELVIFPMAFSNNVLSSFSCQLNLSTPKNKKPPFGSLLRNVLFRIKDRNLKLRLGFQTPKTSKKYATLWLFSQCLAFAKTFKRYLKYIKNFMENQLMGITAEAMGFEPIRPFESLPILEIGALTNSATPPFNLKQYHAV